MLIHIFEKFAYSKGIVLKISDENAEVVQSLLNWFDMTGPLDLKKGILLLGNIGTGKTTLMNLIRQMERTRYFHMVEARHIVREYQAEGATVIDKYGRGAMSQIRYGGGGKTLYSFCFDDLGLEEVSSKLYGNQANVMEEIMQDRYSLMDEGMITHAISNLDVEALKNIYGNRTIDRFKEMFNIVTLKGSSNRGKSERVEPNKDMEKKLTQEEIDRKNSIARKKMISETLEKTKNGIMLTEIEYTVVGQFIKEEMPDMYNQFMTDSDKDEIMRKGKEIGIEECEQGKIKTFVPFVIKTYNEEIAKINEYKFGDIVPNRLKFIFQKLATIHLLKLIAGQQNSK